MSAALRAAADAFTYDIAMLIHVADLLEDVGLELRCDATGWTTRQSLGHLAANYERYATAFERRAAGQQPFAEPYDAARNNPLIAEAERDTPPETLIERLRLARARILASMAHVSPGMERAPFGEGLPALLDVARAWSRHGAAHAVDFIEAAPTLATDLLVANWAFYPLEGEDARLDQRRKALLKQLRSLSDETKEQE